MIAYFTSLVFNTEPFANRFSFDLNLNLNFWMTPVQLLPVIIYFEWILLSQVFIQAGGSSASWFWLSGWAGTNNHVASRRWMLKDFCRSYFDDLAWYFDDLTRYFDDNMMWYFDHSSHQWIFYSRWVRPSNRPPSHFGRVWHRRKPNNDPNCDEYRRREVWHRPLPSPIWPNWVDKGDPTLIVLLR